MYKALLSLILTLLAMQAGAQNARFIEADKTWHVVYQYWAYPGFYEKDYGFTAESDVVINGKHYMRLFEMGADGMNHVVDVFREEDGKVYRYDAKRQEEQLCYDFTLRPMDVVTLSAAWSPYDYQCHVTDVEELTLADGSRASKICFTATPLCEDDEQMEDTENIWIEGIGNVCSPTCNIDDKNADGTDSYVATVKRDGEVIYNHTQTNIMGVRESSRERRSYDIQGRRVDEARQHGLVITAGRKVWRK